MAKIRGVKPDYWTDEDIVELSIPARLLFIGLWNYACDNGHLQDKPRQIKMRILPGDDGVNCAELLRELALSGVLERVDGWLIIPNLTKHQRPDKRYFTTCDFRGCEPPEETLTQREARRAHPVPTTSARRAHAFAHVDGDGDGDGDVTTAIADAIPRGFEDFWNTYDKKRGRKVAIAKFRLALKKPGVSAESLTKAAAAYIDWQRREGKHPEFTKDPATWLNGEHWNDERQTTKPKVDPNWALR